MKKHLFLLIFIVAAMLFTACQSASKKQMALAGVDDSLLLPAKIFKQDNTLYFVYNEQGQDFYLSAAINSPSYKKVETSQFNIEPGAPQLGKEILPLSDISELWDKVVNAYALSIVPDTPLCGVIITVFTTDGVLYRDEKGKIQFSDFKDMPKNINVIKTVNHEEFIDGVLTLLSHKAAAAHPNETKFIFHLDGAARVPFIYLDAQNSYAVILSLPDFYKIKKDLLPFGYTVKIVYSFFVKSHLFTAIKAPFTTLHRLLNQLGTTMSSVLRPGIKSAGGEIPPVSGTEYMDIDAFNAYLDKKVSKRSYKAKVQMLIDGEEFFSHFQLNAANATNEIYLRLYVFATDPYALSLADLLKQKSKEGVKVKVLLDELNTVLNWNRTPRVIPDKDYKMPSINKYLKKDSKVKVRTHPNTWVNFAHTKVIIIDHKLAYTGGMNFGETYRYFWHDMMFALEGPIVDHLRDDFNQAWLFGGVGGDFASGAYAAARREADYEGDTSGMSDVRILYTTPGFSEIFNAQIAAIQNAKKRIYLQNPYFSDPQIINELIKARERGVDVRIIFPTNNNVGLMGKNNLIITNTLIKNGIRVYMYKGMTHIKAGLFDGWASVGSANFDRYSLYVNQEMNLGISDPAFIKELEDRLFKPDFAASEEVSEPFSVSWGSYIANALNPMK